MNSLRQFLICAILFSAILAVYSLDNDSVNTKGELEAGKQDVIQSSASEMARRRRHRFGQHLWIGGIHAISALVAIKFKLVLIFLAVMGTVFYGYKIYAGSSCPTPIISEHGGSILPFEGYSSSFPGAYSTTYPGSDPYSAYSADHGISAGPPSGGDVAPPSSGPYRRVSTQKRSSDQTSSLGFDFGELAFTLLGVESKVCRKRFICEMSVNYRRNPIVGSAYTVISRQFFPQYAIDIDSMAPKSVKQCAMMFRECRGPTDPIPEDSNNGIDESVNATAGENEAAEVIDQSRAAKPKLDQVQRFVVGSKKTTE